ncbi:hypothetical protein Leryth_026677, partial [Lithospermum erythrorhizon]
LSNGKKKIIETYTEEVNYDFEDFTLDYLNKAIMEKEANSCRSRDGSFYELLGCNRENQLLNLRARFCIVSNGELPRLPGFTSISDRFLLGKYEWR